MLRSTLRNVLTALTLVLLCSCTAEQIYTNIQDDHVRQCRLLPVWQQEHCLSLNDTAWEDYVRERQAIAAQSEED